MSTKNRALLEATLFNLRYDMDCIGESEEMYNELIDMLIANYENGNVFIEY